MILNDTKITRSQTRKTHHALNINTNVNFELEYNISSPSKTHNGASWTLICWDIAQHKNCTAPHPCSGVIKKGTISVLLFCFFGHQNALVSALPYVACGVVSLIYSSLADYLVRERKLAVVNVRKISYTIGKWIYFLCSLKASQTYGKGHRCR